MARRLRGAATRLQGRRVDVADSPTGCPLAPTVAHAANCCSPSASSKRPIEPMVLSKWLCLEDNDDFVLTSLVSSCSNAALCAQGLYLTTESRFIPRACLDGASSCLQQIHG